MDLSAVRWFEDKESATAPHRLAFEAMQAGIFEGTIKTVVVWKLDRLSRRLRDGINLLADWCKRGVRVVAVTQQIDLSGTIGSAVHCRRALSTDDRRLVRRNGAAERPRRTSDPRNAALRSSIPLAPPGGHDQRGLRRSRTDYSVADLVNAPLRFISPP